MKESEQGQAIERHRGGTAETRQAYQAPVLTELGRLADLTKGGNQEQRGEGPGFSL